MVDRTSDALGGLPVTASSPHLPGRRAGSSTRREERPSRAEVGRNRRAERLLRSRGGLDGVRSLENPPTMLPGERTQTVDDDHGRDPQRPWTVQVLVGFIVGSLMLMLGTVDQVDLKRYAVLALAVIIAAALWRGETWAYTVSFMFLTLGAGLLLLFGSVRLFLLEEDVSVEYVSILVGVLSGLALLLHSDTRRFARVQENDSIPRQRPERKGVL